MVLRLLFLIFIFLPLTLLSLPIQFVLVRFKLAGRQFLPRLFHKTCCWLFGLKVQVLGHPLAQQPTLLVSNHISWMDIIAAGSAANVLFVAKSEIAKWPLIGFLASLQNTIFVDRNRKKDTKRTSAEMASGLAEGGAVLLFAEGGSHSGTHVLPFRSALIGAAQLAMAKAGANNVAVQPLTIAYTRVQGLPIGRTERGQIAWSKSKSLWANVLHILGGSKKTVTLAFGAPIMLKSDDDRKKITRQCEHQVRQTLVRLNRGEQVPLAA